MNFFVVFMECRRNVVVKKEWISNPIVGAETRMFYSNDRDAVPNFEMVPEYYLNSQCSACYNVFVIKSFGKV